MAWIKGNKLINIVEGVSETGTLQKLEAKIDEGWEPVGKIKPNGYGYACLITRDIKGRKHENQAQMVD